jgi:hypothetical protein
LKSALGLALRRGTAGSEEPQGHENQAETPHLGACYPLAEPKARSLAETAGRRPSRRATVLLGKLRSRSGEAAETHAKTGEAGDGWDRHPKWAIGASVD